jgi:hypothetical protein
MSVRLFKGVGVGTYLHSRDLAKRRQDILDHIAHGTVASAFISLTASYAIAEAYAKGFGKTFPTSSKPAHVYVIDIPDGVPSGITIVDPVAEIVRAAGNPTSPLPYHHDGGPDFLLGVVSPVAFATYRYAHTKRPGSWATPRAANLSLELEVLTRVLRDAEVLVLGGIPASWITHRHLVS